MTTDGPSGAGSEWVVEVAADYSREVRDVLNLPAQNISSCILVVSIATSYKLATKI